VYIIKFGVLFSNFLRGLLDNFITTLNMEVVLLVFIKQQETEDLPF